MTSGVHRAGERGKLSLAQMAAARPRGGEGPPIDFHSRGHSCPACVTVDASSHYGGLVGCQLRSHGPNGHLRLRLHRLIRHIFCHHPRRRCCSCILSSYQRGFRRCNGSRLRQYQIQPCDCRGRGRGVGDWGKSGCERFYRRACVGSPRVADVVLRRWL